MPEVGDRAANETLPCCQRLALNRQSDKYHCTWAVQVLLKPSKNWPSSAGRKGFLVEEAYTEICKMSRHQSQPGKGVEHCHACSWIGNKEQC
jgi:hypothetical protein